MDDLNKKIDKNIKFINDIILNLKIEDAKSLKKLNIKKDLIINTKNFIKEK